MKKSPCDSDLEERLRVTVLRQRCEPLRWALIHWESLSEIPGHVGASFLTNSELLGFERIKLDL